MQAGAVPARTAAAVDQPLGLYRRGRVRDFGRRRATPRRWPTRCSPTSAVKPIGLGARDSLRLEAGLPLYGHDLDRDDHAGRWPASPSPSASAAAPRAASPAAHADHRASSTNGPVAEARRPRWSRAASRCARARWSSTARAMRSAGSPAAASRRRSSGRSPWAMSPPRSAEPGTALKLEQRGKLFEAKVAPMPFVPHRYHRKREPPHEPLFHQGA